jgi:hypothetical protein
MARESLELRNWQRIILRRRKRRRTRRSDHESVYLFSLI